MENSPIATLSAELRNQIYHLVLTHPEPIIIISSFSLEGYEIWSQVARQRKLLALTRTCRAIREEAIKIFYAVNTFTYVPSSQGLRTQELVQGFDKRIGREFAALIHNVVVKPVDIIMTTLAFQDLGISGDDGVFILTAEELIDLASTDNSRTYQLQCTFHCYIQPREGSPGQVWQDSVMFDVHDLVMGCKEARAGMRQKIGNTNDPGVRVCLEQMGKKVAYWQAIFSHDCFVIS
ncbi:hypothetical protein KC343_g6097 [Hortaea werneckii]|nr:hypothetical protein KC338_g4632 [Hortaea werneckii]KAI7208302.1 hypothetical protein KC352_g17560 [Hortaea werneckii]KAI7567861.1 hypothetical protein KC317_g4692 [Hortaea werneckii]KAI7619924.1 hypothetical protein KC346_g4358 [Hortaea werneckii]KAI7627120.1 hypothetical protein KC343_g6097 [Hortaea werneckii]